jgi:hypothetical protein
MLPRRASVLSLEPTPRLASTNRASPMKGSSGNAPVGDTRSCDVGLAIKQWTLVR